MYQQHKCHYSSQQPSSPSPSPSRYSFTGRILLVLFVCILDLTDGMYYHHPSQWPPPVDVTPKPTPQRPPPEPYFVTSVSKNSTIRQGDPAFLSCKVENLGAYTVSWIRVRDLHILTVDRYTYTGDQRFQSLHNNETGEWTLNIKWTEGKSTGIYECQVSTLPVKSLALYLIVLDESELVRRQDDILYDLPVPASLPDQSQHQPNRAGFSSSDGGGGGGQGNQLNGDIYNRMYADRDYLYLAATTQIVEGTMVYGYKGEDLNLTCMVNHNYDRRPNHVIWYHQNDIVAYESLRKRDKSPLNSITSHHLIRNVDFEDAGNYTCAPEYYISASTIVQILDGDEMQNTKNNVASVTRGTLPAMVALVTVFGLCIHFCHPDNAR